MQAVILLGGLGTRLYPLTYTTPKVLLPIGGRPFLAILLDWLRSGGVTEAVFAVSHLKDAISNAAEQMDTGSLAIRVIAETQPLGSAGALKNCADVLAEDFLLLNGDVLMNVDLAALMRAHRSKKATVTVSVTQVDDPTPYGIISTLDDGRVDEWQEKPRREEARSNLANVGAWAIGRRVLEYIPENQFVSLEKETFPLLLKDGAPFFAFEFSGYWKDIGTPDKYFQANMDYLTGQVGDPTAGYDEVAPGVHARGDVKIGEGVRFEGPVLLGNKVQIGAGARIVGPAVIGDGCTVGENCRLSRSVLWAESRIGDETACAQSIVAGAVVEKKCSLDDTLIAQGSRVGAGVRLGAGDVLGPRSVLSRPAA